VKKKMTVIMFLLMTIFTGFGIIIPVMPVMVEEAGAAKFHLGLMLAVYSAASFFMSPVWGALSDRIGRRPLIIVGLLGFSLSFFLFGISAGNLWLMYISRILGGVFSGAATSCAVAYVADITDEENRTKGMGLVGMSIGLGFIFGPAIGGLLSRFGVSFPFFASSGVALLTAVFSLIFLQESLPPGNRTVPAKRHSSRWAAFTGMMKYLYLLSFFVSFTLAGLEGTLQYFQMSKIGATPFDVGMMFFASGIVGALIQGGVVRKYIKNGREKKAILAGLVLSAAGFVLLLFSSGVVTAAIYLSVFAAGNALIRPCVTSLITQKTNVGQGVATGLNSSMDSLGRMSGPVLGTLVIDWNENLPFLIGALLSLAALLLLQRYVILERMARQTG